jgi:hypothetical protein
MQIHFLDYFDIRKKVMILRKQRVTIIYQHHFIISVSNTEKKKFVVVFICLPIVSITMKEL